MSYILVADVGGTKLATALFHQNLQIINKKEVASDKTNREVLFTCLLKSFQDLCEEQQISFEQIAKVAVGVPGIVDPKQGIAVFQNNIPWESFPLSNRLIEIFPHAQIKVDNDVYMATWGEYQARTFSKETMVYMTLSTGISCCTIVNGEFVRGAGFAGEIGFNPVEANGQTLEESVAGPAIEERGRRLLQKPEMTLKDMMLLYYQGNEQVTQIMKQLIHHISAQLQHIILLLDPHCIVLGGGFFNHHPIIVERIQEELQQRFAKTIFAGKEQVIECSMNKGDAGLYGGL
ncbi:ROK family protein [Metasolibacillus meyeri]|uniref:ROK family protein n=1 Tax=Metasolibacillus meyeri TaxID=1071052 RepID=A0AAW9NUE7_9BACL|nr:ROK family protein [Metasolibacillus meyeri]MEC1177863.1 ROK family protein [Metasolibacillus meyeri]